MHFISDNGMGKVFLEAGRWEDLPELERLYDELNGYLASTVNYPGWIKGVYPVRETAAVGLAAGTLWVARKEGSIAGTMILNRDAPPPYQDVAWPSGAAENEAMVLHTFAVHPREHHQGVGGAMLQFAAERGKSIGAKAVRLDAAPKNTPAIRLYEAFGFQYVAAADLGYGDWGLPCFYLYERLL